jgi:hypothetical protein
MCSHRRFARLRIVHWIVQSNVEAKNMMGILSGSKNVTTMEIVWRNPNRVRPSSRRHSVERAGERAIYILQEFVQDGQLGFWTTLSGLEVVVGGRAA